MDINLPNENIEYGVDIVYFVHAWLLKQYRLKHGGVYEGVLLSPKKLAKIEDMFKRVKDNQLYHLLETYGVSPETHKQNAELMVREFDKWLDETDINGDYVNVYIGQAYLYFNSRIPKPEILIG